MPGSPGQFFDEGLQIAKTTSQPPPTTLHQAQSISVRDANQNRKRPREVATARPASNTKQRLINLLQVHAAKWPAPGTGHAYDAYSVHGKVADLAKVAAMLGCNHDFVGTIINQLYAEDVHGFRAYTEFVEHPPT